MALHAPQAAFAQAKDSPLLGTQQKDWVQKTQSYCDRLMPFTQLGQYPRILLVQPDATEFLAGFMAACLCQCPVFLGNPAWSAHEWRQVLALAQPHQVWGTLPVPVPPQPPDAAGANPKGWILIPTGGSSGQMKFAIHTWQTLSAAVQGFQTFWQVPAVNACCVLPLYHVSGLMQFLRSLLTQGRFLPLPFADLLSGQASHPSWAAFLAPNSPLPPSYFLSLVPTQLHRLLQHPQRVPWLCQFSAILLGGAPAPSALLEQARALQVPLAPTYGMTETAAQVATLKPQAFLKGETSVGQVLPHAQVRCLPTLEPRALPDPSPCSLVVQAQSLFEGYYPNHSPTLTFETGDRGYFDRQGNLYIQGRDARLIISGGENIVPEEVEAALYTTGLVEDVYVFGLPDPEWGEVVAAMYVSGRATTPLQFKEALIPYLSPYKIPKRWFKVSEIGRTPQGKINNTWLHRTMATLHPKD